MVLIQPDTNNYIALENRNGNIVFHSKSILNISGISGPKTFVGEDIVIAGFGIQDSTYDD